MKKIASLKRYLPRSWKQTRASDDDLPIIDANITKVCLAMKDNMMQPESLDNISSDLGCLYVQNERIKKDYF